MTVFAGFRELTDVEREKIVFPSAEPIPAGMCRCSICGRGPFIDDREAAREVALYSARSSTIVDPSGVA